MSSLSPILLPAVALCALFMTACGGGENEAPDEVAIPDAPDAAIQTIGNELADGNGGILWKAMPGTYQSDLNTLAQLAGTKVDPELYNKSFALIGRVAEVADQKKDFILNTELGGKQPEEQIAKIATAWPSIIGFVKTVADSPLASVEGLQAFDGQSFFDTTVSTLIGYTEDLATLSGEPNPLQFGTVQLIEASEGLAVLEMISPAGEVVTENFMRVEGRWVPAELATDWLTSIDAAKAQLEAISPEEITQNKPQILGVMTMIEGILIQIEAAQTQEQFDQALKGAMMPLMGLMMMQQGMSAPSAPVMPGSSVAPSAP